MRRIFDFEWEEGGRQEGAARGSSFFLALA